MICNRNDIITHASSGGYGEAEKPGLADILEWEPAPGQWRRIGSMKQARVVHGVSVIRVKDVIEYCDDRNE